MSEPDDDDYYDETEWLRCPRCDGFGDVDCHCGGDLCVCENYGRAPCPVCGGEGEVTEERYTRYQENQRRNDEAMRRILSEIAGRAALKSEEPRQ